MPAARDNACGDSDLVSSIVGGNGAAGSVAIHRRLDGLLSAGERVVQAHLHLEAAAQGGEGDWLGGSACVLAGTRQVVGYLHAQRACFTIIELQNASWQVSRVFNLMCKMKQLSNLKCRTNQY